MSEIVKPSQVTWAVYLLLGSLAIGLVNGFLDSNPALQTASLAFVVTVIVLTDALILFFIYKINVGRNWARITFLVLFLLGIIPFAFGLVTLFNRSVLVGSISVVQLVMQIVAVQYLFTKPGSTWFKKTQESLD